MAIQDDWEFEETEDAPEVETEPTQKYEIMNYPADTTLSGYLEMWDRKELVLPEFQRAFIWDQVKASKLIESFLLGLPVPGVFLFKERDSASYLIIDGQQRITSVISYLKGIIHERAFRLKNVDPKWEGKKVEDLSEDDQFRLKGCVLRSTIIQQINPADKSSIYHIFERLNTGGVNLNPMEIRQCISYGPFVECLKAMNKDENWRILIGRKDEDKRFRDVELVLRCLALAKRPENYEKPMKGFLNDFMEIERKAQSNYDQLQKQFAASCLNIRSQLGDRPFHLRGRLNYGMLDAILSTELRLGPLKNVQEKFQALLDDDEFRTTITKNTSDTITVENRLRLASKVLVATGA